MRRPFRRKRPPARAEIANQLEPPARQHHDVLVFPKAGVVQDWQYFRLPVTKKFRFKGANSEPFSPGEFNEPPEKWDLSDNGHRVVVSTARPHDHGDPSDRDRSRGPAFATLPVKPDPGSASFPTCFVINVRNLDAPNLWTIEEWNDGPSGPDFPTPRHSNEAELLIACPRGRVFRLKLTDLERWGYGTQPLPNGLGEIEAVDLRNESEVWTQLRNGVLAGRTLFQDTSDAKRERGHRANKRVVPLVNITALEPGASAKK